MRTMRIGVPSGRVHAFQQLGQVLFQPLGAAAQRGDVEVAAGRAGARHPLGEAAVVAAQGAVDLVEHAEGAAVRALALPAAVGAVQHRGVAAPVQEHHGLCSPRATRCTMASSSGAENTVLRGWWFMSTRRTSGRPASPMRCGISRV
jgi:hypothetical protein